MKVRGPIVAGFLSFVLLGAACTAGGGTAAPSSINPSGSHAPVTITLWGAWTGRELREFTGLFKAFEAKYPWITVKVVGGIGDTKIIAAINSGTPPDAVLSFALDDVGKFCKSGAWQDLTPYIKQSNFDLSQFPPSVAKYTAFAGRQCAFPFLTDATGLYYNKGMFAKAGITAPPKTFSELTADAKKLTVFNPDGSIKVAGFVPWIGYYENDAVNYGVASGAHWYKPDGTKSAIETDPAWANWLKWQKNLVDFYGVNNLQKFVAGQGSEFSSANDFETGRVAMNLDGEWRVAFIKADKANVNYGTAPFPVADNMAGQYGIGRVGGTIIGIPKGSPHPNEAWLLVSWMATDTKALVTFANDVSNVPTTFASLKSPDLQVTPQFKTFLDIFSNPGSHFKETSGIGADDQAIFASFIDKWQAGQVSDLQAGLRQTATQIDAALAQA